MEPQAFKLLAVLSGLELSADDSRELYEYTRQLFASLKPQSRQPAAPDDAADDAAAEAADEQVRRIFGQVRSIGELDLDQVEPALNFSLEGLSGE